MITSSQLDDVFDKNIEIANSENGYFSDSEVAKRMKPFLDENGNIDSFNAITFTANENRAYSERLLYSVLSDLLVD